MRILGVIVARGGSTGIPKKNIRQLGGQPLIAWTISTAHKSDLLARTILSTDDEEIAAIGRSHGADVPFRRPAELATDRALAIPVLQHALETTESLDGTRYDAVMMLQPTTPFRTPADIDGSIRLFSESGADSVISVVDVGGHHPARMKYLEDGVLIDPPFSERIENQPRQALRPMYIKNGAIYLTRRKVLLSGSLKGSHCHAWVMPEANSVNIDTELDFRLAECLCSDFPQGG